MENFKNIASSILIVLGSTVSFLEAYTIYARAIAATLAVIVSLITIYRWLSNGK